MEHHLTLNEREFAILWRVVTAARKEQENLSKDCSRGYLEQNNALDFAEELELLEKKFFAERYPGQAGETKPAGDPIPDHHELAFGRTFYCETCKKLLTAEEKWTHWESHGVEVGTVPTLCEGIIDYRTFGVGIYRMVFKNRAGEEFPARMWNKEHNTP